MMSLEEENTSLEKLLAEAILDQEALQIDKQKTAEFMPDMSDATRL